MITSISIMRDSTEYNEVLLCGLRNGELVSFIINKPTDHTRDFSLDQSLSGGSENFGVRQSLMGIDLEQRDSYQVGNTPVAITACDDGRAILCCDFKLFSVRFVCPSENATLSRFSIENIWHTDALKVSILLIRFPYISPRTRI
jgi:hypothetical protein